MTYREELQDYIGLGLGLVGITPNRADYSSGNPLLETGTAYVLLKDPNEADRMSFILAINLCIRHNMPFITKKPVGADDITHDDLIGMIAGGVVLGGSAKAFVEEQIVRYGQKHFWIFSTTGKLYWTAIAKPWHKAYYILATDVIKPKLIDNLALAFFILLDAYTQNDSSSEKRLSWLMIETTKGKSKMVDFAAKIWYRRLKKTFGTVKGVFKVFHGINHVFTKYAPND
jgi:hypothetical protein